MEGRWEQVEGKRGGLREERMGNERKKKKRK